MNNADKFKQIFDLYATELWAMSEKDFLAWLNAESDVPDRKVGKWMAEPNCWYRCSNCGQHYPSIRGYMYYNYCPNCGARMERSKDGEIR